MTKTPTPLATYSLISLCVLVGLLTLFGSRNPELVNALLLTDQAWSQPWRLITPAFLHFGLIHIAFNMLWLFMLGKPIERYFGSIRLLLLVLITGLSGNLSEFMVSGPRFGGMSGVVYGLLGYIWMFSLLQPRGPLRMPMSIVVQMLIWFVLCWTVFKDHIANYAHTAGLLSGIILGVIDGKTQVRRNH